MFAAVTQTPSHWLLQQNGSDAHTALQQTARSQSGAECATEPLPRHRGPITPLLRSDRWRAPADLRPDRAPNGPTPNAAEHHASSPPQAGRPVEASGLWSFKPRRKTRAPPSKRRPTTSAQTTSGAPQRRAQIGFPDGRAIGPWTAPREALEEKKLRRTSPQSRGVPSNASRSPSSLKRRSTSTPSGSKPPRASAQLHGRISLACQAALTLRSTASRPPRIPSTD